MPGDASARPLLARCRRAALAGSALALGLGSGAAAAQAATLHVRGGSIGPALARAHGGDTVMVHAGRYPRLMVSRRFARRVTIRAFPGDHPVLWDGFEIRDSSHVRVQGFRVTSRSNMSDVFTSDHVSVRRNDFSGSGMILRAVRHTVVQGNRIHDLERPPGAPGFGGYGMWINGYWNGGRRDGLWHLVIRDNLFRNIPQDAIQIGGGNDRVAHVTIAHNHFDRIRRATDLDHPDPIQIIGARGAVIRGNLFTNSEDAIIVKDDATYGLRVMNNVMIGWRGGCIQAQFWNTPGAVVENNTIWNSQCLGLRFAYDPRKEGRPSGIVVRNNIADTFAVGDRRWMRQEDYNLFADHSGDGRHDLGRRPRFAHGWRLAEHSPGIDAGDSAGAPRRDRAGRRRADDLHVRNRGTGPNRYTDMGAYEHPGRVR